MYDTRRLPITSSWHSKWPPKGWMLQAQSVWSDSSPQPTGQRGKPRGLPEHDGLVRVHLLAHATRAHFSQPARPQQPGKQATIRE